MKNASTYSRVMVVQETVAYELQRDRGLAHPAVAEHHDLVDSEAARRARSLARHTAACLRATFRPFRTLTSTSSPPSPNAQTASQR